MPTISECISPWDQKSKCKLIAKCWRMFRHSKGSDLALMCCLCTELRRAFQLRIYRKSDFYIKYLHSVHSDDTYKPIFNFYLYSTKVNSIPHLACDDRCRSHFSKYPFTLPQPIQTNRILDYLYYNDHKQYFLSSHTVSVKSRWMKKPSADLRIKVQREHTAWASDLFHIHN